MMTTIVIGMANIPDHRGAFASAAVTLPPRGLTRADVTCSATQL